MFQQTMIEGLESRVLMSTTPVLFNTAIKIDRLVTRADILIFESHSLSGQAKLIADTAAIKKNLAPGDTSLVDSFQTLRTDSKALATQLRQDRLTESAAALADESVIKLDIVQIIKDRKNATALAADRTKLMNDRVTLQNDLLAGLDARIATRQSFVNTISADTQAIVTAANNDPAATTGLQTAVATFKADRDGKLTTLTNDLQTIVAARTQLAADLQAAASA